MKQNGILILGHGTPSPEGTRAFLELAKLVEAMAGDTPVVAGFMEFASPTIIEGAMELKKRGAERISAVPVFLSAAGHTADDIPQAVEAARKILTDTLIHITRHIGSHLKVIELSALRYQEALVEKADIPPEQTIAVIAAHGSPETEAFEELEQFAAARHKLVPIGRTVPCFSQMGTPLLAEILPSLAELHYRRIVVQPHFLLKGRMIDAIARTTAAIAGKYAEIEFVVAEPLGSHRLLAEAVLELGNRRE